MATIKLPHFGMIDSNALEEYYDVDIDFNNINVQLDLNFESKTIEVARLEKVKQFIENIRIHDLNNKKLIRLDYDDEDNDTVRTYIEHHIEELAADDLEDLTGRNAKKTDIPALLIKKLQLVRLGLYPDSKDQFAIFDYSLGQELTNYLVVIFTDENGNLEYMTMES